MGNIKAEEAMRELTLMLLYLSRFTQMIIPGLWPTPAAV